VHARLSAVALPDISTVSFQHRRPGSEPFPYDTRGRAARALGLGRTAAGHRTRLPEHPALPTGGSVTKRVTPPGWRFFWLAAAGRTPGVQRGLTLIGSVRCWSAGVGSLLLLSLRIKTGWRRSVLSTLGCRLLRVAFAETRRITWEILSGTGSFPGGCPPCVSLTA
jgi:hypothetical protein